MKSVHFNSNLFLPFKMDDAHNCTWISGILEASCIAGVTMFIDSRVFPNDKNMCPNKTNEHEVSLFKSSAFAIFNVSRRYLLLITYNHDIIYNCDTFIRYFSQMF